MISLKIEREDGTTIRTEDVGFTVDEFVPSAPVLRHTFANVVGAAGNIDLGSELEPRTVRLSGYFESFTKDAFQLHRELLFRLFVDVRPIWITDSRFPYKRWRVKLDGDWTAERVRFHRVGEVSLTFVTVGPPYAHGIQTTATPYEWGQGHSWMGGISWGQGGYVFTDTNRCIVRNMGDVTIDPREHECVVTYRGASDNLHITNRRTNDVFVHHGTTGTEEEIKIDRVYTTRNGLNVVRETNYQLLTFEPGENEILLAGTSSPFEISFDFRPLFI